MLFPYLEEWIKWIMRLFKGATAFYSFECWCCQQDPDISHVFALRTVSSLAVMVQVLEGKVFIGYFSSKEVAFLVVVHFFFHNMPQRKVLQTSHIFLETYNRFQFWKS